jgi:CDP-glycerol glycerophosphotransferase (TagB/SpsB family)
MPIKKIVYDFDKFLLSISLSDRIKRFLINKIICVDWTKSDIIISQSDFFNRYLSSAFRNSRIFVTGQPRNDVLFTRSRGELDFGFEIIQNASRRILYMPTHRLYGKGKKEFPLLHSLSFYEFLESLNGVFLFKYHPNMPVSKDVMLNDRFFDISNCGFDVQELLVEADLLISDYSSVVFDYMLLKRIIIFYLYDNYEESNPIYFSLKNVMPYIAYNESELEKLIISVYADTSDSVEFNDKFNAYKDGQSSKRVSDLIKLNLHM